jgi:hypothetical protein
LRELPGALKCILWDKGAQRIISVAEYQATHPVGLSSAGAVLTEPS